MKTINRSNLVVVSALIVAAAISFTYFNGNNRLEGGSYVELTPTANVTGFVKNTKTTADESAVHIENISKDFELIHVELMKQPDEPDEPELIV